MQRNVRWALCVMMFLQYMIWGAWYPDFSVYMEKTLGFSGIQSGVIYSLLNFGCMLAPFIAGQLADRYFAAQKLIAVLHLLGAVALFLAAKATAFSNLVLLMGLWAALYGPTLALTNSITFQHMPEAEEKFGLVRVWGTLGWIAVGWTLSGIVRKFGLFNGLGGADSLWLAGGLSVLLGLFAFALPHTPPAKKGTNPWAFLEAVKLMREPQVAVFIVISFVVSTELAFYYLLTGPFLAAIGVTQSQIPFWMSIAQMAEIGTMLALPWMLRHWGVRKTMLVGILSWPIRYAVFALYFGLPQGIVLAALTLHGLCYVCFFVVSFIYINQVATDDIRASAQGLITFVTLGLGMWLGNYFAGWVRDIFTTTVNGTSTVNWFYVFLLPLVITVLCAIVFLFTFKERREVAQAEQMA